MLQTPTRETSTPSASRRVRVETAEQRARRAERDRERKAARKAERRSAEQRAALALAGELQLLIRSFPAFSPEINELVFSLNQRAAESPDRARDSILHMLRLAPAPVEEMIEELRFSERMVVEVLESLRALGVAEEVTRATSERARGIAPRVWRLTGKAPKTAAVLP